MKKLVFLFVAIIAAGLSVAFVVSSDSDEVSKESAGLVIEKGIQTDYFAQKCGDEEGGEEKCGDGNSDQDKKDKDKEDNEKCGDGKCGTGDSPE